MEWLRHLLAGRSKRANTFRRFDPLCAPLRELVAARTAILDGEVLALDAEGRPRFIDLLRGRGRLAFAEGIVGKRKVDTCGPRTLWYKAMNPDYSQAEGRGDLFKRPRRR